MRRPADSKLDCLRSIHGLSSCPTRELEAMARVVDAVGIGAGDVMAAEGKPGRRAWIVLDGTVEVTSGGNRLWLAGAGTLVGDLGLVGAVPMATSVAALTDVRALAFDPRALDTLLGLPRVCRWVCGQFDRQVRTLLGASVNDAPGAAVAPLA